MATGYTAEIEKGITFPQFAMNCARAFGGLVCMRDEPGDAPIPEKFEPSNYHTEELVRANKRFKEVMAMTETECEVEASKKFAAANKRRLEAIEHNKRLEQSYEAMLIQAKAWEPPTDDHKELKSFMIDQIAKSILFDCPCPPHEPDPVVLEDGETWRSAEIKTLTADLEYHLDEKDKEIERVGGLNEWVGQLRESLK